MFILGALENERENRSAPDPAIFINREYLVYLQGLVNNNKFQAWNASKCVDTPSYLCTIC